MRVGGGEFGAVEEDVDVGVGGDFDGLGGEFVGVGEGGADDVAGRFAGVGHVGEGVGDERPLVVDGDAAWGCAAFAGALAHGWGGGEPVGAAGCGVPGPVVVGGAEGFAGA
jgi:hypothetical protein